VFKLMKSGSSFTEALGKQFAGAGSGMASFGSSLAAAGVAIPIVVAVVGAPLVAAFSMLLGVISAALVSHLLIRLVRSRRSGAMSLSPLVSEWWLPPSQA